MTLYMYGEVHNDQPVPLVKARALFEKHGHFQQGWLALKG